MKRTTGTTGEPGREKRRMLRWENGEERPWIGIVEDQERAGLSCEIADLASQELRVLGSDDAQLARDGSGWIVLAVSAVDVCAWFLVEKVPGYDFDNAVWDLQDMVRRPFL